jgi:hypothetical protein
VPHELEGDPLDFALLQLPPAYHPVAACVRRDRWEREVKPVEDRLFLYTSIGRMVNCTTTMSAGIDECGVMSVILQDVLPNPWHTPRYVDAWAKRGDLLESSR